MTLRPKMEEAESNPLSGISRELKAVLAATDPKLLRHVLDQLRSAGNAAFKSRRYRGTRPFVNMYQVLACFIRHYVGN